MNKIGKYIYGIMNFNTNLRLFVPNDSLGGENNGADKVYAIPYQDISAVVSDSEILDYTHLLKDTVARYLIRHQQIIEKIMESSTIIPMRLGTFASDEDEVRCILAKTYSVVRHIFNKIHDKIEIDVAATWSDFNSVLKELSEEKEIKELKQVFLSKKAGITVDDQMKIGVMIKKVLDKKREKYVIQIQKVLKSVSQDFRAHELMDDKMVLNCAFLIDKGKHKDFEKTIEELNAEFAEKLNFRSVGPLPPYSFYTLEVRKMRFEEIDWARRKLGLLNEFSTKDEIKKAHKTLAFTFHPDKNPDTPGIEREFDEVTKAYKLLCEYCQGDSCSFKEEEFKKNALLVKVRG